MKTYREKTSLCGEITSQTIADDYTTYIDELANCINKINDINGKIQYLSSITEDNGDVGFALDEAIIKLGIALATACSYRKEYQEEANEEE